MLRNAGFRTSPQASVIKHQNVAHMSRCLRMQSLILVRCGTKMSAFRCMTGET